MYHSLNHSREKKENFKKVIFDKLDVTHESGMKDYRIIALSTVGARI